MLYRPFVPGITVAGYTVRVFTDTLRSFPVLREAMLATLGATEVDDEAWYSQEDLLRAYQKVDHLLGGRGLERFGRLVPALAVIPPTITGAHAILSSLDVVFHLHHRRDGAPMFDSATGVMQEGIGHYRYERIDEREARLVCDNPYPCRFDLGLCNGFAALFEPTAAATHEPGSCRTRGDAGCGLRVRW
jgi:hypothetical protein